MFRNPLQVRDATPADAPAVVRMWAELARRFPRAAASPPAAEADGEAAAALARIATDPDERLIIGVVDDDVVGAMHLRRAPISPIHTETSVHTSHLYVVDGWRRQGVGRALMEAAVSWAEEKDTAHIMAASPMSSRDANRFMARIGLGPIGVIRGAPVQALRGRLPRDTGASRTGGRPQHDSLSRVIASRRSQRRREQMRGVR